MADLAWVMKRDGNSRAHVVLGAGIGRLDVKRIGDPGVFITYHNDTRISAIEHHTLADGMTEAVRYVAALPAFKDSPGGIVTATQIEDGRQACRDGKSIYDNPFKSDPQGQTNWLTGWLETFGAGVAARAINAAVATARANTQLEQDLSLALASLHNWRLAYDFADTLRYPEQYSDFWRDWKNAESNEALGEKWPAWIEFTKGKV